MSTQKKIGFTRETSNDERLKQVKEFIQKGWPKNSNLKNKIRSYYNLRDHLTMLEHLIFYNDRLAVLHEEHQGIVRNKLKAKETLFWPRMSEYIELMVENCVTCQMFSNENPKQPRRQHGIPDRQ